MLKLNTLNHRTTKCLTRRIVQILKDVVLDDEEDEGWVDYQYIETALGDAGYYYKKKSIKTALYYLRISNHPEVQLLDGTSEHWYRYKKPAIEQQLVVEKTKVSAFRQALIQTNDALLKANQALINGE